MRRTKPPKIHVPTIYDKLIFMAEMEEHWSDESLILERMIELGMYRHDCYKKECRLTIRTWIGALGQIKAKLQANSAKRVYNALHRHHAGLT